MKKHFLILLIFVSLKCAQDDSRETLNSAICQGDINRVEYLLSNGVDSTRAYFDLINAMGPNSSLKLEVANQIANIFQKYRLNINEFYGITLAETCLYKTVSWNYFNAFKMLLEHGADPNMPANPSNRSPIMESAEVGYDEEKRFEIFKLLIEAKANHNHQDENGNTTHEKSLILHYISFNGLNKLKTF